MNASLITSWRRKAIELLIVILAAVWGGLSALAMRYAFTRWVFRCDNKWWAALCSYAAMLGLFFLGTVFVDNSGFALKSYNEEPLAKAGFFVLFLSPIGLPLAIGGPIVFIGDMLRMLNLHFTGRLQ